MTERMPVLTSSRTLSSTGEVLQPRKLPERPRPRLTPRLKLLRLRKNKNALDLKPS